MIKVFLLYNVGNIWYSNLTLFLGKIGMNDIYFLLANN